MPHDPIVMRYSNPIGVQIQLVEPQDVRLKTLGWFFRNRSHVAPFRISPFSHRETFGLFPHRKIMNPRPKCNGTWIGRSGWWSERSPLPLEVHGTSMQMD